MASPDPEADVPAWRGEQQSWVVKKRTIASSEPSGSIAPLAAVSGTATEPLE